MSDLNWISPSPRGRGLGEGDGAVLASPPPPNPLPQGEGEEATPDTACVFGIGNADRGDDAVGPEVIRLLRGRVPPSVHLIASTTPMALPDNAQHLWLVDAAQSGAPPGTVHRIDCNNAAPLPSGSISSHGFGVAESIALARALGTLPRHCIAYAIEAAQFDVGAPLTTAVANAACDVAERILAELTPPPP